MNKTIYIADDEANIRLGNNGIGLSIVKSIVEQHKGYIAAENADHGGTVLTIILPIHV